MGDTNFLTNSGLEYVGFAFLVILGIHWTLKLIIFIYKRFLARSLDVKKCGGDWALVTGSTDGIGKAYAFALAKRGLNIVLVSRTQSKLDLVAAEIEKKFSGIRTLTIAVDYCTSHLEYIPRIESAIQGLKIGVLVNNVGMAYDYPEFFLDVPAGKVTNLIDCNIVSVNAMTQLILPQMVDRKNGVVINIASTAALLCVPLLSVYSGTKAYVDKFTEGLQYEYQKSGVTIQCVLPGYVVSNMSRIYESSFMVPTAENFVESAMSRLGIYSRTTGYFAHDLIILLVNWMPGNSAKSTTFKELLEIREKELKEINGRK